MKRILISNFLTDQQITKAIELRKAKLICDQIIKPNIETINAKLGQRNDPMYLAYAVEYVISISNPSRKDYY